MKRAVCQLFAVAAAVLVGAIAAICTIFIAGGSAAVLLEGGMLWPSWADPIILGLAALAFVASAVVTFRDVVGRLKR